MTQTLPLLQLAHPEHKILWTACSQKSPVVHGTTLKRFFVQYARKFSRAFPWRSPGVSPFELLVAEMLLVQTKAEDVEKLWSHLVRRYPSAQRLARAQTGSLTKFLTPLGLQNQRARALKSVARAIVERFGGEPPSSIPELLSLPYVGLYVACAVACFSYGERVPIVDANVLRIVGRLTGIEPGKELRRSPGVWNAAWAILPANNFALHNYGVLDFAAGVCKPRVPLCQSCQLNTICAYARTLLDERAGGETTKDCSRAISGME